MGLMLIIYGLFDSIILILLSFYLTFFFSIFLFQFFNFFFFSRQYHPVWANFAGKSFLWWQLSFTPPLRITILVFLVFFLYIFINLEHMIYYIVY